MAVTKPAARLRGSEIEALADRLRDAALHAGYPVHQAAWMRSLEFSYHAHVRRGGLTDDATLQRMFAADAPGEDWVFRMWKGLRQRQ